MGSVRQVRMLTVSDLHQSVPLVFELHTAVVKHKPQIIAFVGDVLEIGRRTAGQFTVAETARALSRLETEHIVFVRGNHEETAWKEFTEAWPHKKCPLVALHQSVFQFGPLIIVGFPCEMGDEYTWVEALPESRHSLERKPPVPGQKSSMTNAHPWLEQIVNEWGEAARSIWLMHEPPLDNTIADMNTCNLNWGRAVESFGPLLTISGHDHRSPTLNKAWHARKGETICVNAGQGTTVLHYSVIDFEFVTDEPSLPARMVIEAFPWQQTLVITS